MIRFRCAACGKSLKAPAAAAGKSARCTGCGAPVRVPETVNDPVEPPAPHPPGAKAPGLPETSAPAVMEPGASALPIPENAKSFLFHCEYCDRRVAGLESQIGLAGECPHCGQRLAIERENDDALFDPRHPKFDRADAAGVMLAAIAGIAGAIAGLALSIKYFQAVFAMIGPFPGAGVALVAMGFYFVGAVLAGIALCSAPFLLLHALTSPRVRRKRRRRLHRKRHPTKPIRAIS